MQAALYNLIVGALALCLFVAICLETGKRKKQQKQKKEYVRTDRIQELYFHYIVITQQYTLVWYTLPAYQLSC